MSFEFKTAILVSIIMLSVAIAAGGFAVATDSPLHGKIIALDAGHGSNPADIGATGSCDGIEVREIDMNIAVRSALTAKLETDGAIVFLVPQLASRKERVAAAEAAGAEALISIHHNGLPDPSVDYTQSFITQNRDKALAQAVHPALVQALGLPDHGIKNDGYGMTVYGKIPSVLTEAYFVTNSQGACEFIDGTRITKEIGGFYAGLVKYFFSSTGGGRGRGK